jgi:hypothetical protein
VFSLLQSRRTWEGELLGGRALPAAANRHRIVAPCRLALTASRRETLRKQSAKGFANSRQLAAAMGAHEDEPAKETLGRPRFSS